MAQIFVADPKRLEPLKLNLCEAIERVIVRKQWTYREAAIYMGTTPSNVSLVANKRIHRLSVSQLFNYLVLICPDFRFMLSVDSSLAL